MKLRRLLALILALVIAASVAGCDFNLAFKNAKKENAPVVSRPESVDPPSKESVSTPLLYKVSDGDSVVWLFGSIHVGREEFYPLPDYVWDAYEQSEALAVEFDIVAFENDTAAATQSLMLMTYSDGTTIKDHISPELYEEAVEAMKEYGGYFSYYDMFMPVLWSSLIENAVYAEYDIINYDLGIDRHMLNKAKADGKKILDVESAEFQYGMMAGYSEELQALLLEEAVALSKDSESLPEEMDELMDLWQAGDEAELSGALYAPAEIEDPDELRLYEEYNNALVVERNISMTEYAEDALENNDEIFICVGAAHVVGPGAMAQLLSQKGYTVEIVR